MFFIYRYWTLRCSLLGAFLSGIVLLAVSWSSESGGGAFLSSVVLLAVSWSSESGGGAFLSGIVGNAVSWSGGDVGHLVKGNGGGSGQEASDNSSSHFW